MKHYTSSDFWDSYRKLPTEIRELADKNYELLKANPRHPSLQLKRIEELWNFRADLQEDAKLAICPFFNPFRYRLGRYIGYINTSREQQLNEFDCRKLCVIVMENLIYTGVDDLSRNLIVAHILSALTVVSTDARTSMPWLYDSIMYLFSL